MLQVISSDAAWSESEFRRLTRAIAGHRKGPLPRPDHVSVVVRVDTEPDSEASYAAVHPEMIDSLPLDARLESVDHGLSSLDRLGFDIVGFGAPRNSISDEARDRLMEWNLEYDGSAAYDPLRGLPGRALRASFGRRGQPNRGGALHRAE